MRRYGLHRTLGGVLLRRPFTVLLRAHQWRDDPPGAVLWLGSTLDPAHLHVRVGLSWHLDLVAGVGPFRVEWRISPRVHWRPDRPRRLVRRYPEGTVRVARIGPLTAFTGPGAWATCEIAASPRLAVAVRVRRLDPATREFHARTEALRP